MNYSSRDRRRVEQSFVDMLLCNTFEIEKSSNKIYKHRSLCLCCRVFQCLHQLYTEDSVPQFGFSCNTSVAIYVYIICMVKAVSAEN